MVKEWDDIQKGFDDITAKKWNDLVDAFKGDIGTILINSTGDFTVDGLDFAPTRIKFQASIPIDGTDVEFAGSSNSDTEDNFAGTMVGFAKTNDGGDTTTQQVIASGGSGNSINAIRAYSSSSYCIGVSYGDADANEIGQLTASLSSWNSDGFTVNCDTYNVSNVSGLLVMWTTWG